MANELRTVVVNGVRFAYAHVFEPSAPKLDNGKTADPRYKTLFFAPVEQKEVFTALRRATAEELQAKFPNATRDEIIEAVNEAVQAGDKQNEIRVRKNKKPEDWRKGVLVASASSQFKPGIAGPDGSEIINPAHFYGGCYGAVEVSIKPYASDKDGSIHVALYLNYVLKTKDGDRIGGVQRSAADVFAGIVPSAAPVDPETGEAGWMKV